MADHYEALIAAVNPPTERVRSSEEAARITGRLDQLPMADPQHAIRELLASLDGMLFQRWSGADRAETLRGISEPVEVLAKGVSSRILSESHPLPAAKQDLAEQMLDLRGKANRAWMLAIHEMCAPGGKVSLLRRRRTAHMANLAAANAVGSLMLAWQLHQTPPAGTWQSLHALHAFAAANGLDQRASASIEGEHPISLAQRYAGCLLVAMANPFAFQQRELAALDAAAAALASATRFRDRGEGLVRVAADGPDSGPSFLSIDHESSGQGWLAFDPSPAIVLAEEQIQWTPDDVDVVGLRRGRGQSALIDRAVLSRAMRAWKGFSDRGFQRMPAGHRLDSVLGLHAIHQVLAGGRDFEAFQRQLRGGEIELGSGHNAASWASTASEIRMPPSIEVEVLDQSLGGYRLAWPAGGRGRMRIGDMVALAPHEDRGGSNSAWLLGLVRWLRGQGSDDFQVGVELIAHKACAAAVRSIDNRGDRSPMLRALLLLDENKGSTQLAVPHLFPHNVDELEWGMCADPVDQRPAVRGERRRIKRIEALSPAYYRVLLEPTD